MPDPYRIPTRRERNIRYLEIFGFGALVGFIAGTFVVLIGLGVLK